MEGRDPGTKHEVDRMTRRWYIAIRNFPNERSVGRRLLTYTLISSLR